MLEDKTYKIKVAEYHDAVIYVYERHRKCLNPKDETENHKWKHWKEVVTVIPVAHYDGDDYQDASGRFHTNIRVVVDALTELYGSSPDYEMGISYTMNTHQSVSYTHLTLPTIYSV